MGKMLSWIAGTWLLVLFSAIVLHYARLGVRYSATSYLHHTGSFLRFSIWDPHTSLYLPLHKCPCTKFGHLGTCRGKTVYLYIHYHYSLFNWNLDFLQLWTQAIIYSSISSTLASLSKEIAAISVSRCRCGLYLKIFFMRITLSKLQESLDLPLDTVIQGIIQEAHISYHMFLIIGLNHF